MIEWIDYTETAKNPPQNRALLAYCPDWCDIGYAVVTWNGANFEDEIRGEDIHDYVVKWSLILKQTRRITRCITRKYPQQFLICIVSDWVLVAVDAGVRHGNL